MNPHQRALLGLAAIVAVQAALLWRPMREDSATVDEPVMLGAGESYWRGHRYFLNVEHPPLAQLANALPVLYAPPPTNAASLLDTRPDAPVIARWDNLALPAGRAVPQFYYVPVLEGEEYGREFVFATPGLLFWGRIVPVLTTLATTVLVFAWAGSGLAGLLAAAAWAFNPVALAHGHLATTDAAAALCLPLALWMFARFSVQPTASRAAIAGVACGIALLVKFTAVALLPAFLVVAWLAARRNRGTAWSGAFLRGAVVMGAIVGVLILLVYAPDWKPAPPVPADLAVPDWFRVLRPVLIPPTFFKGLALVLTHAARGHAAYLHGQWSDTGWWYYFPVAFLVKTPVALLGLCALGIRRRAAIPLIGATVYFALAMFSRADLGIRHLLPVYALLAVAIGAGCRWRLLAGGLAVWLMAVAMWSQPRYLQYFNELAGGAANGQRWLVDSNFDWGQDAQRLKKFLDARGIEHIAVSFFGRYGALDAEKVLYTRVDAESARHIERGWLVVSATNLMKPEWSWLRQRNPDARIADTLFAYHIP